MDNDTKLKMKDLSIVKIAGALGCSLNSANQINCFVHEDSNPSLTLYQNSYYCFGCKTAGDNIDFVRGVKGLSYPEAYKWIEETFFFGGELIEPITTPPDRNRKESGTDGRQFSEVYSHFLSRLATDGAIYYMKKRGIPESVTRAAGLKVVNASEIETIKKTLLDKWGRDVLLDSGIFGKTEIYRFKYHPVIIPHFTQDGEPFNLNARAIDKHADIKYMLLPGIRKGFYGLPVINGLTPGGTLFICEGAIDALSLTALDMPALALSGNALFTPAQLDTVRPYRVVIVPDKDEAGVKGMFNRYDQLEREGIECATFNFDKFKEYYKVTKAAKDINLSLIHI